MTKIDHKGLGKSARKRAKAGDLPPGVPALKPVPRKQPNGRTYREPAQRDPQADMLKARCRRWGSSQRDWRDMRDPWWGCEAGGAMAKAAPRHDDRTRLWGAICHMRKVVAAFDAVMGAPRRHAQCLRLLLPIEAMEADASSPAPDDRSDEQKQDDAVMAYQWLGEWLGRAGPAAQSEAERVVLDDQRPADVGLLLSALHHISDGITARA
ncbi:hypothetical protein [Pseudogemmobacter sonorensis]|uniref:hypothetical protein n=1 Tax=Pseudogemmobacter sonorensis TaxID=2989681 RepID=UPI003695A896